MTADIVPIIRLPRQFGAFSYTVPPEMEGELVIGQCVSIPFRTKKVLGIVTGTDETIKPGLKPIVEIINTVPLIGSDYIEHLKNLARMYGVSLSAVMALAVPGLQPKKIKKIEIAEWRMNTKHAKKPDYRWYKTAEGQKSAYTAYEKEKICIIVPEISLIDRVLSQLSPERQKDALNWTAEMSVPKKRDIWFSIRNHTAKTMIATRGAVWIPLHQSFDRIIIECEYSENHKHWNQNPRYHTKDIAKLLSRNFGVEYAEMSYSPSVASFYFTRAGLYAGTAERMREHELPIVVQESGKSAKGKIYRGTVEAVAGALDTNGDAVIICNRKSAPVETGEGIENIVQELRAVFPEEKAEIVIASADMPLMEPAPENLRSAKFRQKPRIIVCTRSVISNLFWERIKSIVLADFDDQLCFPEYGATETVRHEIMTVLFYKKKKIPFIIQTKQPEHPLLAALSNSDVWYKKELKMRSDVGYPPFSYLARYCVGGKTREEAKSNAEKLCKAIRFLLTKNQKKIIIQGPISGEPEYHLNEYWNIVIIKISEPDILSSMLEINACLPEDITVKIDPNPLSLLNPK